MSNKNNPMDTAICKEVIVSTIARRGTGERKSPIRVITQVFEKDGTLIAEYDPRPELFAPLDMINFAKWCIRQGHKIEHLNEQYIDTWLESL